MLLCIFTLNFEKKKLRLENGQSSSYEVVKYSVPLFKLLAIFVSKNVDTFAIPTYLKGQRNKSKPKTHA